MSEQNLQIVRRLAEAMDGGGWEAALALDQELFDEGIEWIEDPSWPGGGTYVGLRAVRALLAERTDGFEVQQHTEQLLDAGDDVVALIRWRGRGSRSGAETETRLATVTTLRDGKIVKVRFYLDRAEALRAVGLDASDV
jgi:ketosteroid isomerase-like protein